MPEADKAKTTTTKKSLPPTKSKSEDSSLAIGKEIDLKDASLDELRAKLAKMRAETGRI